LVRSLVDYDLTFAVSIRDLTRPLVKRCPIQPHKRSPVEIALDEVTNESRLTIPMGTREIELATAVHCAVAVVVRLAFENPLIGHVLCSLRPSRLLGMCSASALRPDACIIAQQKMDSSPDLAHMRFRARLS
jgi:hypothetical protein